jgi:hypothetical protein
MPGDVCTHLIDGRVCYYCELLPPPALPQEEDEEQEQEEERGGKRGEGKGGVATSEGGSKSMQSTGEGEIS